MRRTVILCIVLLALLTSMLAIGRAQARPIDGFGPFGLRVQAAGGLAEVGQYHLGEERVWCIDLNSSGPHSASGWRSQVADRVRKQTDFGDRGGHRDVNGPELTAGELAEIAAVLDWARAGVRDDETAAAVDHVIRRRTVGDDRQRARMEARYRAVLMARPGVAKRVENLEASLRGAGADRLELKLTAPTVQRPGAVEVSLLGPRGSGPAGVAVTLQIDGRREVVTTDGGGQARFALPARPPGELSVTANAEAPALRPILYLPRAYADRRSPDHLVQRMMGAAARLSLQARAVTRVEPLRPGISTLTSAAVAEVGASLTDQVELTGAEGVRLTARAVLWGPYWKRPTAEDCRPNDPKAGEVTFKVTGNGRYRTPPITVRRAGFYVWQEFLPATDTSAAVQSPCGVAEEISLVKAKPVITTVTSAAELTGGGQITDLVRISGLWPDQTKRMVTATLFGPYSKRPTIEDCRATDPKAGTVQLEVTRDGDHRTPAVAVKQPGFYVWQETLAADEKTSAVTTPCGEASEITLVNLTPPPPASSLSPTPSPVPTPTPAPSTPARPVLRIPSGIVDGA